MSVTKVFILGEQDKMRAKCLLKNILSRISTEWNGGLEAGWPLAAQAEAGLGGGVVVSLEGRSGTNGFWD